MRRALVLSVAGLLGCSSPAQTYSVSFPSLTVAPGVERTQCVVKRLGNGSQIHVGSLHNVLGDSSHHMIIYRVADTTEQPTPFDCQPFVDTLDPQKGAPLMITQKKDEILELPAGVAYTLAPNQMIRIELHYINATSAPVTLTASTTMTSSHSFRDEADFLFIGNPDIHLPPHTETTLGPTFYKLPPGDFADVKFFALTGHEHKLGTDVTVAVAASADDPGTSVYAVPNWQWSEPATVFHDPPFALPAGGGFSFTCTWNNTSDAAVRFGESANDEMCFFWAYYYPSHGAYVCMHTSRAGGHDFCCPGSFECSLIAMPPQMQ